MSKKNLYCGLNQFCDIADKIECKFWVKKLKTVVFTKGINKTSTNNDKALFYEGLSKT